MIGSGSYYKQDGILPFTQLYLPTQRVLQFPTGWNSTIIDKFCVHTQHVSIPNGMEFYPVYDTADPSATVSIPNGMEFYLLVIDTRKKTL